MLELRWNSFSEFSDKLLEMIGESELSRFQKAIKVVAVYEFTKKTEPEPPPQESQENTEKNTEITKSSKLKYIAVDFLLLLLLLAGGGIPYFLYVQEELKQEELKQEELKQEKLKEEERKEEREKEYKTELEAAKSIVDNRLVEYKKELEDAKKLDPELAECNKKKCSPPCKWEVEKDENLSEICKICNKENIKTCTDKILEEHPDIIPELLPIGKTIEVPKI